MSELLTIKVYIDDYLDIQGHTGQASMIMFHGEACGPLFWGTICPGAVDTQFEPAAGTRGLSARYMLTGHDAEGNCCKLFIQNEGIMPSDGGIITTTPKILTDSTSLGWLEEASLTGTVIGEEDALYIRIYRKAAYSS